MEFKYTDYFCKGFILVTLLVCASFSAHASSTLDKIKADGELRVAVRDTLNGYTYGLQENGGLEYDLVQLFATHLGVKSRFITVPYSTDALDLLNKGVVHLAAAGLIVTPERQSLYQFGPVFRKVVQQVIYKSGKSRPRSVKHLIDRQIMLVDKSVHHAELEKHAKQNEGIRWTSTSSLLPTDLMRLVDSDELELTIASSDDVVHMRQHYPSLKVAFDLTKKQALAWAFEKSDDDSLQKAVQSFFKKIKRDGRFAQLTDKYFGFVDRLNNVDAYWFKRHVKSRLPRYLSTFQKAAEEHGLDWRLLAAVGYQESHWNSKAVSPTGVRGLMMLTRATAKYLGVKNRLDPKQSIEGGARYIKMLQARVNDRVQAEDRLWLALAGYNIGYGHLRDARKLTKQMGGNPDRWSDVKKRLPLLEKKKWYAKTKYGTARGREAVHYVDSVRAYYNLLNWVDGGEKLLASNNDSEELIVAAADG